MMLSKVLLISVGVFAIALALIGIVVPLLPTTPLLLLAAACFVRSSDRLYNQLIGNRWFGRDIQGYLEHRTVPRRSRILALVMLWGTMTLAVTQVGSWWLRGVLVFIAILVTAHLLRLKSTVP
jgi:uncharacterized membrane protein YbaN (DUF454 family)